MSNSSHCNPAARSLRELRSLCASWVICFSWGFIISGAREVIYTDSYGTEKGERRRAGFGEKRQSKRLDLHYVEDMFAKD